MGASREKLTGKDFHESPRRRFPRARRFIRRQIAVCHFYVCKPRRWVGGKRRVIKERRGALSQETSPRAKKGANRMSYVGWGARIGRAGWRNWKHMGALAFPFFHVFPYPFSSSLSFAVSPSRGRSTGEIEIFT